MSTAQRPLGGNRCLDFINNPGEYPASFEVDNLSAADQRRAHRFRALLRRILTDEAGGSGAATADLAGLNRILAHCGARRGLVPTVRGYGWGWLGSGGADQFLWPVAFAAARLLEGPDLARLKHCDGCGQLFLDQSRNRARRWCDMQGCGNREKQRRWRDAK
jgi:predicted RNA-binding Zn ribbon-like protein